MLPATQIDRRHKHLTSCGGSKSISTGFTTVQETTQYRERDHRQLRPVQRRRDNLEFKPLQDFRTLELDVSSQWDLHLAGNLDLAAVSLATNMAILLAKQLDAEARGPFILELERP
jgi:hypothetical protein